MQKKSSYNILGNYKTPSENLGHATEVKCFSKAITIMTLLYIKVMLWLDIILTHYLIWPCQKYALIRSIKSLCTTPVIVYILYTRYNTQVIPLPFGLLDSVQYVHLLLIDFILF